MARYTVGHDYAASHDGKHLGPWTAGDEVELDDAEADWVERDSPGALVQLLEVQTKATEPKNRQRSTISASKPARAVRRGG